MLAAFTSIHVSVVRHHIPLLLVLSCLAAWVLVVGAVISFILLRYGRK